MQIRTGPVLAFSPTVLGYRLRASGVPQARPPVRVCPLLLPARNYLLLPPDGIIMLLELELPTPVTISAITKSWYLVPFR